MLARMSLLPCWKPRWRKILSRNLGEGAPRCTGRKENRLFADLRATQRVRLIAENVSPQRCCDTFPGFTSWPPSTALKPAGRKTGDMLRPALVCRLGLTDDRHPQSALLSARRGSATLRNFLPLHTCVTVAISIRKRESKRSIYRAAMAAITTSTSAKRNGYLWAPGLTLWKSAILKLSCVPQQTDWVIHAVVLRRRLRGMGCKGRAAMASRSATKTLPLWRMEDGFLRSSGLGSDFCRRYRWYWINAGSTMTPRAQRPGSAA